MDGNNDKGVFTLQGIQQQTHFMGLLTIKKQQQQNPVYRIRAPTDMTEGLHN